MNHILEGWLKGAVEEANMERALKEVSESTLKEQVADLANFEQRFVKVERARAVAEKRWQTWRGK